MDRKSRRFDNLNYAWKWLMAMEQGIAKECTMKGMPTLARAVIVTKSHPKDGYCSFRARHRLARKKGYPAHRLKFGPGYAARTNGGSILVFKKGELDGSED